MNSNNYIKKIVVKDYLADLYEYVKKEQFINNDLLTLFINQFKNHTDTDSGWRGEFWGKVIRGACYCYKYNKDKDLYISIVKTVKDMISIQEKDGRISSYPKEVEFKDWDMWGRKYVMLGLIYFLDICESIPLRNKVIKCLEKHADYIIKHVGKGSKQIPIELTSSIHGSMNSFSILSPMVRLYNITKEEKYLTFSTYLVDCGLAKTFNLIEASLDDKLLPFEFKEKKAYEMMSCLNGLLDYYQIYKNPNHLLTVKKFVDKLIESDYSIIGCSGTDGEFLNNSSINQTKKPVDICQETCVTVTLMDLCEHLFEITKQEKYISIVERSIFNAFYGSINNELQTMKDVKGNVWTLDGPIVTPHKPFPFDSYSPVYDGKRGHTVGGFMVMGSESYGCCAAIGGFGLGLAIGTNLFLDNNNLYINLYQKLNAKLFINDLDTYLTLNCDIYNKNKIDITIKSYENKFNLKLRIPSWMKNVSILVDGKVINAPINDGYVNLLTSWNNNKVTIKFDRDVEPVILNNKIAFTYGPIVLASDNRYNKDNIIKGLKLNKNHYNFKKSNDYKFKSNSLFKLTISNNDFYFVDYSQAGKNFDNPNSKISVWLDINN